tara:strand:- start:502 stop:891 length:390 start_codon:yes stop_codon:yes gene_type:complete
MTEKDPNYIPKLEKAIAQKYGPEAIDNPRKFWDETKEQEYIQQSKLFVEKLKKNEAQIEKVETDGFLVNKKLLNKDTNRVCSVCNEYSFDVRDNLYINKFDCCWKCYIQWIEGREERWLSGWRPKKENK